MRITDREWNSRLDRGPVDLDTLLAEVVDGVAAEVGSERATLFLVDRGRQELVSRVAHLPEIAEIRLRLGEGIAGSVAARRRLSNVPVADRSPVFAHRIDLETGFRTRSLLAVPVLDRRDEVLGVLEAVNKRDGDFGPDDEATMSRLAARVAELLVTSSLASQLQPEARLPLAFRFNGIVGESFAMRRVLERAARAARTEATVLVRGESGTGKELIARAIHVNSARAERPLVKVDCAALPGELVENELFGHVRGAYTGADRASSGKVATAEGGTLFLDEIGELGPAAQGRLLRLVQDREYYPVGGDTLKRADVRIVTATNRDLERDVASGGFRQDLYYRLRVVELELPSLRERGHAELDRLIDHFLYECGRRHARPGMRLSSAARGALHAHAWPGNVRELEHHLESAVVLSPSARIELDSLPSDPTGASAPSAMPEGAIEILPLREVERRYVARAVELCDGNRSKAARLLGIGRNTLLRKLGRG
jgi:Nif-specific regulatory protein